MTRFPNLVACTEVDEIYTNGGHSSPDVDKTLNDNVIEQFQTAIRGAQTASPFAQKMGDRQWGDSRRFPPLIIETIRG